MRVLLADPVRARKASSRPAPRDLEVAGRRLGRDQGAQRGVGVVAGQDHGVALLLDGRDPGSRRQPREVGGRQRHPDPADVDRGLDLGRRPVGDHPAAGHQHDPVRGLVGLLEVVRGEQHAAALAGELVHRRPERATGLDVHRDGGLVEHDEARGPARPRARTAPAASGRRRGCRSGGRRGRRRRPARAPAAPASGSGASRRPGPPSRAPSGRRAGRRTASSRRPARTGPPSTGSSPKTETVPLSGRRRPRIISIVVVLPAPLGPSRATTSPAAMLRSTPSTATTEPNVLRRPATSHRRPRRPPARLSSCPETGARAGRRAVAAVRTCP